MKLNIANIVLFRKFMRIASLILVFALVPCNANADLTRALENYLLILKGVIDPEYLSVDELKEVHWLVERIGDSVGVNSVSSCDPPIETTIDGSFEGWEGDTIVQLSNGDIWQQNDYKYKYMYVYYPDVLIYLDGNRCILVIIEEGEGVSVKKLN